MTTIRMTTSKRDDDWRELCEAIMREPDSKRLLDLVRQLNELLEERENSEDGTPKQQTIISRGGAEQFGVLKRPTASP
jgi:hypothetical protein